MIQLRLSHFALALCLALSVPLAAQTAEPQKADDKKDEPKKEEPKKEEPKKDPKAADYEKAIKDLKRVDGPLALYLRKKDVLLELPESQLGKVFLGQAALSTALDGSLMHAGMMVGGQAVDAFRFDRNEDKLWLVRPRIGVRWDKDDPFAVGAERTYQESVLGAYTIEQTNPEKKLVLVNVTDLFYGEVFRLGEMVTSMLGGPYQVDRAKSGVERANGYPENTVVSVQYYFYSARGPQANPLAALLGVSGSNTLEDSRSAPLKVVYNLWFRKEGSYKPRLADTRVGYFTNDFQSFGRYTRPSSTVRYINRFHLEKKDPAAKLSEPVQPIVWTIDPSIPAVYRGAVRDGVLFWNRAFEALGYKDAVRVQDPPKDDKDYDHADGRYNVIRMSPSQESMFTAIALARNDPFTGQVYNASVTLDGNLIRDLMASHRMVLPSPTDSAQRALSVLTRSKERAVPDDVYLFEPERAEAEARSRSMMNRFGWNEAACTYARDLAPQVALAWHALNASGTPTISREDFVRSYLRDCVAHEVGHTLGLRHNFAGSAHLTTAQLADDQLTTSQGVTASVMDYTPPNAMAVLRGKGNFFNVGLGPYDLWAIRYGYSDFGPKASERYELSRIAQLSGLDGHAYMTDEDADRWNPYAVRFDLAVDPLNYLSKSLETYRRARQDAIANLPRPGEPYSERTKVVMNSILRSFRDGRNAARFLGGMEASRNFKGDRGEKPTLQAVSPQLQRQAMALIVDNFLAAGSFDLPAEVLNSLSMSEDDGGWTAPLRDIIGSNQDNLAALVLSAATTDRIAENAFKTSGPNAYTLDQHYGMLIEAVFKEVGTGRSIVPLRRDLQKFVLNGLMTQAGAPVGSVNEDVRTLASDGVRELGRRFAAAAAKPGLADGMTRAHLRDGADQVRRFLDRLAVSR